MKNIVSIALLLLILLQSFSKTWIVISFKINQDRIAKELCANRFTPEMHCHGKCVLKKRILADEETGKRDLPQKLKKLSETPFCIEPIFSFFATGNVVGARQPKSFFRPTLFVAPFLKGIFHPPDFLA